MLAFDDWRKPRYEASMWWCGDENCDCYQPRITLRTPNLTVGYPCDRLTEVWEGTFHSSPGGEEYAEMEAELAAECDTRSIPMGSSVATGLTG